ncbi:MAG: SO_0444 family Cu/Zn efflux transporter [Planctomycetota bacterium]
MEALLAYFQALWTLLAQTGWWLIAGLAAAGLVHTFVPADALRKQIGERGAGSSAKAALVGVLLPLCSCSVIPVAAGLRKSGASRGAAASFAISTPQTGEESIPLTWALFGPVFALIRPIAAIVTAITAGTLIDALERSTPKTVSLATVGGCCCAPDFAEPEGHEGAKCCASEDGDVSEAPSRLRAPVRSSLLSALRHGFVTLPLDLAPWLIVGFLLSAAVSAAVPVGWIGETIGTGLGPMLLMVVIGLPLYICATSSTPLAYTLVVAGLSPGAALVLLLAGPATNVATIAWAIKDLGVRGTAIYLASVAIIAIVFGLAIDAVIPSLTVGETTHAHEHSISVFATLGGAALSALLVASGLARLARLIAFTPSTAPTSVEGIAT